MNIVLVFSPVIWLNLLGHKSWLLVLIVFSSSPTVTLFPSSYLVKQTTNSNFLVFNRTVISRLKCPGVGMESSDPAEIRAIRESFAKALDCLNTGLQYDDTGNKEQALLQYRLGRRHLLGGLEVNTQGARCVGRDWDVARQTQLSMNETLSIITSRLGVLESTATPAQRLYPTLPVLQDPQPLASNTRTHLSASGGAPARPASPMVGTTVPSELPPAYTPQPTDGHLSFSHGGNRPFQAAQPQRQALAPVNLREVGMEILFLPSGVQMFFVSAEGHVSAPSYPGYLRIIIYSSQNSDRSAGYAPAYLQVCDWIYPLYPDSPILLSNKGVFTFPDTTAGVPGSYVGVVLSSELPAADRDRFQQQLSVLAQLRVQVDEEQGGATGKDTNLSEKVPPSETQSPGGEEKPVPVWSEKMSESILAGTSWLGRELVRGAEVTGKAIQRGATKLRENITPEETPAEVSPKVTKGLNAAKQATGGAVKVSQFLVDGVAAVADRVGKELAPHMKKHGSKLIPESLKKSKDGCSKMDGAKLVAGSSIQGLSTLWSSLETAAKTIGKSITSETVTTVRHKFRGLGNLLDPPSRI
ncbi:spartin a isoform X2 [Pimephales promelas]|uniref:spartin a isoform X2 n=1 Tax=Pimephales promelas TaxID=90988 RepID=UPI001955EC48|nr:spartin a isoform X2 [Pimephales promelas]